MTDSSSTNTPEPDNSNETLVARTKVPHSHGQAPFPPYPQSEAAEARGRGPGGWHRQEVGWGAGRGTGHERRSEQSPSADGCASARLPSGCSVPCFVPVPGCPEGAACPAFLAVTFSRGMWQLLTGLSQGCFDQSFLPASPLSPSSGTAAAHCHLQ